MNSHTRRDFLKTTSLAVLPTSILRSAYADASAFDSSMPFVRMRQNADEQGWRYVKVRTLPGGGGGAGEVPDERRLSKYGGNGEMQLNATGKFRVEKSSGRWWFVDPEGHPFLSCGVNSIRLGNHPKTKEAAEKLGGEAAWSEAVVTELRGHGFNTAGSWSALHTGEIEQTMHKNMPYVFFEFGEATDPLKSTGKRPHGLMDCFAAQLGAKDMRKDKLRFPAFHRDFELFCAKRCERLASVKDDPWLVGFYSDNELSAPSLGRCLEIAVDDSLYADCAREARRWWKERGGEKVKAADNAAWIAHAFDWYYRITSAAIRKQDADHLLLGARYFSKERNYDEVWSVAGKYVDVVSVNPYGMPVVPAAMLNEWSQWAGDKPIIIGEFYVKGADAPTDNRRGAGLIVATQKERGMYYQNYVLSLLESKVCVGWSWHCYADEHHSGVNGQASSNKGLVNSELAPYKELLVEMKKMNENIYRQAAQGAPATRGSRA